MNYITDYVDEDLPSGCLSYRRSPYWDPKQYTNEKSNMNDNVQIVKKVKVYLMSRNVKKQLAALQTVMRMMKENGSDVFVKLLIQTDIPGLLCDVMNNHNPSLILNVIMDLLELSKSKQFYDHKYAALVVETTCRTLKILSNNEKHIKVIYYGLKLVSQILSRSNLRSLASLKQILGLVKDLSTPVFQKIHLSALVLLPQILKVEGFQSRDLLPVLNQALSFLTQLQKNNKKKFKKNIRMVNDILLFSLRYSNSCVDEPLLDPIMRFVWVIICQAVVPLIKEFTKKNFHHGMMASQIQCVSEMYNYMDQERLTRLTNKLAADGFLTFLPAISLQCNEKSLHQWVMTLLARLVETLAVVSLKPTQSQLKLISGHLQSLPPDITSWPQYLTSSRSHEVHLPIIVYFYFVLACSDSFEKFHFLELALCQFLKSQTSPPSPTLLKAVWFVFAVSSLTRPRDDRVARNKKQVQVANSILVRWIQATSMSEVYTHHPALLLWAFNSYVSEKILQINLMMMWLKDGSKTSLKEMENLVLRNTKAALCLLDVMTCCPSDIMVKCVRILQCVLARDKKAGRLELSHYIWSNLSRTLSGLTTPQPRPSAAAVDNVSVMVNLACKVVPTSPDKVTLLRISYQLLTLLRLPIADVAAAEALHGELFKLTLVLIWKMNEVKGYRVLEVFLQDSVILRALLRSLDSDRKIVTKPALNLLTYLLTCSQQYDIHVEKGMSITGDILLQLMSCRNDHIVLASLRLFKLLRETSDVKPIVVLSPTTADHLIRSLYLQFQNLTLKVNDSWRCQILLIEFCGVNNPKMELHLLTTPWTHLALQLAFKNNGINNEEVLSFLDVWLSRLASLKVVPKVNYSLALCQDRLSNLLTKIANEVLKCYQQNSVYLSLHLKIASKVAEIGENIPLEVFCSLEDKILSRNFIW